MGPELFISPPDVRVRIINLHSQKALYSNIRDDRALFHFDASTAYDDQFWYIKPGKDKYKGLYTIKSVEPGRYLYVKYIGGEWGQVGTMAESYDDQFFDIPKQQGQDAQARQFRLHAPLQGNGVMFSRTHMQPELGCVKLQDKIYPDQYFSFEMEPMDMIDIKYHLEEAPIEATRPRAIFSQESGNDTNEPQTPTIKISKCTEQQSTFESGFGVELGVSTTFSCGVPLVAEAEVELSAKIHTNLKWGSTNTATQLWEALVPLTVPPHKTYKVTAAVTENIIKVPFTTTFKSPKTGKTMVTSGMFKGLSSCDLKTNFFEVAQKPHQ